MVSFVYLDQNILSDLRSRRLLELKDETLKSLKNACINTNIRVVYSFTHLQEIFQITRLDYRQEHITLLKELNAIYILPISTEFCSDDPELVWNDFLDNFIANENSGLNKSAEIQDLINRKLLGLPIEMSFRELENELKESTIKLLKLNLDNLSAFDEDEKALIRNQIAMTIKRVSEIKTYEIFDTQGIGQRPLSDFEQLKSLKIENREPIEVIPLLDNLFHNENSDYKWTDFFENSIQNKVAKCYSLMSWAGYYPDDYLKISKKGDRFRASNNDLLHVINATGSTYLVSKDKAFLKKADACYKHLRIPTIVCESEQVLEIIKNSGI